MVFTAAFTANYNTKGEGMKYERLAPALAAGVVLATIFSGYHVTGLLLAVALGTVLQISAQQIRRRRAAFIDEYVFHPAVMNKFREVRPDLTSEQEQLVFAALRDYFQMCLMAGRRMVSMPSQVVDDAWHAFILFTRGYDQFCLRAFGRFLHHTPAEAMSSPSDAQQGIKRAWRLACARTGINPVQPLSLPLLFSIDRDLQIANGFHYVPDCSGELRRSDATGSYCASSIGCSSGCSGDSGSGDGGGDGGGCGGGGD